jgi:hypothetical protein
VRPSEADLIAIARRISGPLSPEGADAWYRNDAAALIEEVRTLRHEAEAARQSFLNDGAQAEPGAPLAEWARAWKANTTGFWEKTQTKHLRQKIVELTRANEDLETTIQLLKDQHEVTVAVINARHSELAAEVKRNLIRTAGLL